MPLTTDQLAIVRTEVGTSPEDPVLHAIFDRVDTVGGTIYEVLAQRLAAFLAAPAQFSIPGEYQQSTAANIQALKDQVSRWSRFAPVTDEGMGVVTSFQLESRHAR